MVAHGNKRDRRRIAGEEDPPQEKWLVAFRNPNSRLHPEGSVFMRQFLAPGYYEAYDAVVSHAERAKLEVLWFKEKRLCESFTNLNFPLLESVCTYCNRKFNGEEPVPCANESCGAEFCSRECLAEHALIKHKTYTQKS